MILKLTTTQKNLTYHYLKQNLLRRFYRLKSKKKQEDIKLKAVLPLLSSTTIDIHKNIKSNSDKGTLAQLYIETVEQFFDAGANRDFSKISNYSDNFYQET